MSLRSLLAKYAEGRAPFSFIDMLNEVAGSIGTYDAHILGTPAHENPSVVLHGVFDSASSGQETPELESHNDRIAAQKFLRDQGNPPQLTDMPKQGGPLPRTHG